MNRSKAPQPVIPDTNAPRSSALLSMELALTRFVDHQVDYHADQLGGCPPLSLSVRLSHAVDKVRNPHFQNVHSTISPVQFQLCVPIDILQTIARWQVHQRW